MVYDLITAHREEESEDSDCECGKEVEKRPHNETHCHLCRYFDTSLPPLNIIESKLEQVY